MPTELCYTPNQIKAAKFCIISMMSLSMFQALTIRNLVKNYDNGRKRFNRLHDASNYLLEIIQKHDIELTEFDLIALQSILEENGVTAQ